MKNETKKVEEKVVCEECTKKDTILENTVKQANNIIERKDIILDSTLDRLQAIQQANK